MSDSDLLEKAAKAAGIAGAYDATAKAFRREPGRMTRYGEAHSYWDPLCNDGDALRLAVRLRIHIQPSVTVPGFAPSVECYAAEDSHSAVFEEVLAGDPEAATRRAIVRVAADMAPKSR